MLTDIGSAQIESVQMSQLFMASRRDLNLVFLSNMTITFAENSHVFYYTILGLPSIGYYLLNANLDQCDVSQVITVSAPGED